MGSYAISGGGGITIAEPAGALTITPATLTYVATPEPGHDGQHEFQRTTAFVPSAVAITGSGPAAGNSLRRTGQWYGADDHGGRGDGCFGAGGG